MVREGKRQQQQITRPGAPLIPYCLGFVWQGSESGRGYRGGICQKLSPCPTEPLPAGSRVDLPLLKAEPVSNGSCTSVKPSLRGRKRDSLHQGSCGQRRAEREYARGTALQTQRSVKKEGKEVLHTPERRFPCRSTETGCFLATQGGQQGFRDPPAAHGGDTHRWMPEIK